MNIQTPARSVVLCANEEIQRSPELINCIGEALSPQPWLHIFSSGEEARTYIRSIDAACDAWVAHCSDIDAINLAAALKKDCPDRKVFLISSEHNGSLRSRASCAGIDEVCGITDLAQLYLHAQQAYAQTGALTHDETDAKLSVSCAQPPTCTPAQSNLSAATAFTSFTTTTQKPLSFSGAVSESLDQHSFDTEEIMRELHDCDYEHAKGEKNAPSTLFHTQQTPFQTQQASLHVGQSPTHSKRNSVHAQIDIHPSNLGFIMPVVSGSGGAGKSTVAILAAIIAQKAGYKTVLVDFDLQFGDVLALIGRDDALRLDEAANSPISLTHLRPESGLPAVLGAPHRLEAAEELVLRIGSLIDTLRSSYEVIIANTGSFWTEQHAVLLEQSSKALFLVDQRPSSLRACQHALELCSRCGIATGPFAFAANRCSRSALYTSLDISCALQGSHAFELMDGGSEVEELLAAGQPLDLIEGGNALSGSIEDALSELLPKWNERVASNKHDLPLAHRLFGLRPKKRRAS